MLDKDGYLRPAIFQILGVVLLVASAVFWALTKEESALFVGAGLTLIGIGSAGGAIITVRQQIREKAQGHLDEMAAEDEDRALPGKPKS